ncbi:MAG: hypothetical protein KDJ36_07120 [Hyphomicrobiaceae bacterium]|nr:hypothetical protein [Hyphomicrobiaceae bacterium]
MAMPPGSGDKRTMKADRAGWMTRRRLLVGGVAGFAVIGAASSLHQHWLTTRFRNQLLASWNGGLVKIPVFDARDGGPVAHAQARASRMKDLLTACLGGPQTPVAGGLTRIADTVAARWLAANRTPYKNELDAIAKAVGLPGVHLLNASYEWGCTALASHDAQRKQAMLLRSLDWGFHGLGRYVELARQTGTAGEYLNVTWPGSVGVLTAMAPGRFAASVNQAPMRRRFSSELAMGVDGVLNVADTLINVSDPPCMHVLRQVFETAANFAEARTMLERTPLSNPTIFTLVGLKPDETCVIERERRQFVTRNGIASAANDWQYSSFAGRWGDAGTVGGDLRGDSAARNTAIQRFAGKQISPFAWLKEPVLNSITRLAVEAFPAEGRIRVRGYEATADDESAEPVTEILDYRA